MADNAQDFDMGTEGGAAASPNSLEQVRKSIQEMIDLQEMIEQMEEDLKAAKSSLQNMRTVKVPDLMAEIQSDHFNHAGYEVKLTEFVSGSLPKDEKKRKKALTWLEKNDGAELITTSVSVDFGKSQHNMALDVAGRLKEEGHPVNVVSGVHAQSLQKFARDCIRDGKKIDTETLGLYTGKVVKTKKLPEKAGAK